MEWDVYLRTVLALLVVVALIAGVARLAKRFGMIGLPGGARRKRRLAIVEMLPLDNRRRLVLVSRDGVEHLLLVGGGADLVIEPAVPVRPEEIGS